MSVIISITAIAVYIGSLVWASVSDVKTGKIPLLSCILPLITATISIITKQISIWAALAGFLIIPLILLLTTCFGKRDFICGGDIKLIAGAGAAIGVTLSCVSLMIACIASLIVEQGIKKKKKDEPTKFGPYIALGYTLMLLLTQILYLREMGGTVL